MNIAYSQLELFRGETIPLTSHDVGIMMGIPHIKTELIVEEAIVKLSPMSTLKDIEAMMIDIDDIDKFNLFFLIFSCATLSAPTFHLKGSHTLWYIP